MSAIVEATERLLAAGGKTSTRGVAKLAGVSVGTLYQYFPGREALVARVIDKRLANDERALLAVFEDSRDRSIAELMRGSLESMLPASAWEIALYPRMVDHLTAVGRDAHVQRFIARFEVLWAEELRRRHAELRPGLEPMEAAVTSIHAIRGALLGHARRRPPVPRAQLVAMLTDLGANYLVGSSG